MEKMLIVKLDELKKLFLRHFNNNKVKRFVFLAFLMLLPCVAEAQSTGSDMITTIVYNLCNYLSGTVARAMGVLVIMFLGYKTIRGQMDWRHAGSIAVGMGLILGGAYYGTLLFGG